MRHDSRLVVGVVTIRLVSVLISSFTYKCVYSSTNHQFQQESVNGGQTCYLFFFIIIFILETSVVMFQFQECLTGARGNFKIG